MVVLFLAFFLFVLISVSFLCKDLSAAMSMSSLCLKGVYWGFMFNFDFMVLSILLMLFMCFGYAIFYTDHYFLKEKAGKSLQILICCFVAVMASLVLTGDFLLTLIFWEYLGVVSFFLILFYLKYTSLRASIVTLVSSRFGDVCLFLIMAVTAYKKIKSSLMAMLLMLVMLTKSASFPFMSWLLEAMRAPTPVSSLVHSSTLVAAGVWFSLRYDLNLYVENFSILIIMLMLTMLMTGVCCMVFFDLKKIVALSTCKNISWCLLYLMFGDQLLCLFQLLSHGISKCLLFMLVGDVMSGAGGSQASKCVYSPQLYGGWGLFSLFSVVLGLSGAPFVSVFFTKHLLLSGFSSILNLPTLLVLLTCVLLSYLYSFRLCRVLYNINSSMSSGVLFFFNSGMMVYFWLFMKFFLSSLLEETKFVSSTTSVTLIIFQLTACLTAYYMYSTAVFSSWSSSLWGCDCMVECCYGLTKKMFTLTSMFFYRWDSLTLKLFKYNGEPIMKIYKGNLLNMLFISLLVLILMCLVMV